MPNYPRKLLVFKAPVELVEIVQTLYKDYGLTRNEMLLRATEAYFLEFIDRDTYPRKDMLPDDRNAKVNSLVAEKLKDSIAKLESRLGPDAA